MARVQTPPSLSSQVKGNIFIPDDFHGAIWENGIKVMHERAVACPCRDNSGSAKTNCGNCLGSGWVYVNPIETKALITSINRDTKYKDWNPEFIGTAAFTFMNVNRVSIGDRITLLERESIHSEVVEIRNILDDGDNPIYFSFLTYKPKVIDSVFFFVDINSNLVKVRDGDFGIGNSNPYVITYKNISSNGLASVTYQHSMVYHVLDIPHDFRISKHYDDNGKRSTVEMPVQAIARKKQFMFSEPTNFNGDNILNNSWLP